MKIGFIGLGIMGHPMALNLIKGGHELFVFGRRRLPAEVRDAGATVCDTIKEIAERSEIVILMVPDTPDVKSVLFDSSGVAEGLSPGKIVVDMSSISPLETKEFAAVVKSAALFARDSSNIIRVKINPGDSAGMEPGSVTIEATAEDLGDNVSTVTAAVDGPELQIIFNVKYLADVLSVIDTPKVILEANAATRPGVIRPEGAADYTYVIMPMHINR